MSKGKRRAKAQDDKRQRQKRGMVGGGTSKYAQKHAEQARGKFRPTSPFYLPPSMREPESDEKPRLEVVYASPGTIVTTDDGTERRLPTVQVEVDANFDIGGFGGESSL